MKYDYTKLRQKFIEKKLTQSEAGARAGIRSSLFSMKLSSQVEFKQSEIFALCKLLGIPDKQINEYFFVLEVQ